MNETEIRELLRRQLEYYPLSETQDLLKALHQAVLGNGHLVSAQSNGLEWIQKELRDAAPLSLCPGLVEPLGPRFCRIHLRYLQENNIQPQKLFDVFAGSSRIVSDKQDLRDALACVLKLTREAEFAAILDEETVCAYLNSELTPLLHSKTFRQHYHPAYRVVAKSLWEKR
ncbi:MAG: hypothetical protein LBR25_10415 [Erysipelotrichaceae bacterium]|jgi:hypothetical protein|nr:hypothetical protein [Erysipelotrichaceae bacterium]